jgi:Flp pilus assembly protein TadD
MQRELPLVLTLTLLIVLSCQKEEPRTNPAATQVLNSSSSESVFDEVKKRLKENPDDAEALYHLADLYDRNEQYVEAIDTYKKVIALKPKMGYAYFKMGTAYNRINQPAEAVDAFNKAIELMPANAVAYNNLGVAYGKLGMFDKEIAALKKAIKIRPAYSSARYNLGMTYIKTGNKTAALKEYQSLKKFDESVAEALLQEINRSS